MRGNSFIDYKQLGLDYKLLKMDVLYNRILVYCQMKMFDEASIDMYDDTLRTSPDFKALTEVIQRREPPSVHVKYIDDKLYLPPKHQLRSKSAPTSRIQTQQETKSNPSFAYSKHITKSSRNKVKSTS
jgi:hypothetical protein